MADADLISVGERVARLLSEGAAAEAASDSKRLSRVRDDAWQIQMELFPLVVEENLTAELLRATILFAQVARVSLYLQSASENWLYALASCSMLNIASANIIAGYRSNMFAEPEMALLAVLQDISRDVASAVAYISHRSGNPAEALLSLENATSVTMAIRMKRAAVRVVERRMASGLTSTSDMMQYIRSINGLPDGISPRQYVNDALKHPENIVSKGSTYDLEKPVFSPLTVGDRGDPLEQFFLTAPNSHSIRAARSSGRALVYVVPGYRTNPGVAIRVGSGATKASSVESILLPSLRSAELKFRLEKVRAAFHQPSVRKRLAEVGEMLNWTGSSVWGPISTEWQDLLTAPLAVVPIGIAGLLPIYTATVHESPVCTLWNITVTPSARALHFSAIQQPPALVDAFIAADPWHGNDSIPYASQEAARIAAIYNTSPVIYGSVMRTGVRPDEPRRLRSLRGSAPRSTTGIRHDTITRLRSASMIHLACHGKMEDNNPCLFLDSQAVSLSQLVDTEESQLAAHPLVVLSACELGGFSASDFSAEQFGFPAGLIAMGARSVVGALWSVPDQPTAEFMEDFHRHLQKFPSNEALPLAIMDAQRRQVSALTWGSFVHFGV